MPQLKIDVDNTVCSAGTKIVGTVQFAGHRAVNVVALKVSLLGRCVVSHVFGPYAVYEGIRLIKFDKVLSQGPVTASPGQSWSFEFTVPHLCTPESDPELVSDFRFASSSFRSVHRPVYNDRPAPRFDDELWQKLPPTNVSLNFFASSRIDYGLEAVMSVGRRVQRLKYIKAWKALELRATKSSNDPLPQTFLISEPTENWSALQLEGRQIVPLSFKNKHGSSIPRFSLELEYPTVGIAGHNLRLILGIRHDSETGSVPPVMFLRKMSIKLVTMTNVKTLSIVDSSQKHFLICKNRHLNKILDGRVEIGNLLSLRLPHDVLPTFASSNVSRTYYLSFKVAIESVLYRKTSSFQFHSGELILLPL